MRKIEYKEGQRTIYIGSAISHLLLFKHENKIESVDQAMAIYRLVQILVIGIFFFFM